VFDGPAGGYVPIGYFITPNLTRFVSTVPSDRFKRGFHDQPVGTAGGVRRRDDHPAIVIADERHVVLLRRSAVDGRLKAGERNRGESREEK
jgi:hypothetical protein